MKKIKSKQLERFATYVLDTGPRIRGDCTWAKYGQLEAYLKN